MSGLKEENSRKLVVVEHLVVSRCKLRVWFKREYNESIFCIFWII